MLGFPFVVALILDSLVNVYFVLTCFDFLNFTFVLRKKEKKYF